VLPSSDTLIALGLIQKPRGLKGELLVKPYQDSSSTLRAGLSVSIKRADKIIQTKIQYVKISNLKYWIKLEGIDDRNQAEEISGGEIYCVQDQLAQPDMDEHFVFDLIGLVVLDKENNQIGVVRDLISNPANDILEIETNRGNVLVPFVKEFIKEISVEKKIIVIDRIQELYPDEN
jgi:16S rRNA processing protein RimM